MSYIIKRDTEIPTYVTGYSNSLGTITTGVPFYEFESKEVAKDITKTLNNLALLNDDPYRYQVIKLVATPVRDTVLAEGDENSAYNKRINTNHDVEIEV